MSFHSIRRLGAVLPRRLLNQPLCPARLQSTKKVSKGVGRRIFIYGGGIVGAAVIGTVVYANHHPEFKRTADSSVPGFGQLVDRSASAWSSVERVVGDWWRSMKKIVVPERSENFGLYKRQTERQTESKQPSSTAQPAIEADPVTRPPLPSGKEGTTTTQTGGKQVSAPTQPSLETAMLPPSDKEGEIKAGEETQAIATPLKPPPENSKGDKPPVQATEEETAAEGKQLWAEGEVKSGQPLTTDTKEKEKDKTASDELEQAYQVFALRSDSLLASQHQLAQAISTHHLQLLEAVKTPQSEQQLEIITGSVIGTMEAVEEARKKVEHARNRQREAANSLHDAITAAKFAKATRVVDQVCEKVDEYLAKVEKAEKAITEAEAMEKQWHNEMERYKEPMLQAPTPKPEQKAPTSKLEQETATPKPEQETPTPKLEQEALIAMMQSSLEQQLAAEVESTVAEALKSQQQQLDKEAAEELRQALVEKERQFEQVLQQKVQEMEERHEERLREELLVQAKAHSYHLHDSLQHQADRLSQQWSEELSTKLRDVEEVHLQEMVAALGQLRGVQSTISTVVEAGETTRRQQSVRTACDALTGAIVAADTNPDPMEKHSIASQVSILLQTARQDEFITTVLSAIPKEAISEGISSEAGLRSRFKHVRKICQRVALVPEEGAGLGTYLLSFLQSLLTIDMVHVRMADSQVFNTDTFELLREADASLQQGQLEMAVRLVNQLEGEPRRVAKDWLREARLYLMTRQAVTMVAEYVAASSISVLK